MLLVNIVGTINYSPQQVEKIMRAKRIMENVLNSAMFKERVIHFQTDGRLTFSFKKSLFKYFDIYANEEVYAMLMQAAEEEGNIANGAIDLYLVLEPGNDGDNLGYGLPGKKEIHTYCDFFESTSDARLANHFIHEWCHKIGFSHAYFRWMDKNRDNAVPYAIGDLVEALAPL